MQAKPRAEISNVTANSAARGRPRSKEAHEAILGSAIRIALQVGYREMGMDQIAADAGVSKMTIYRHWPNKAALMIDAFLSRVGPETGFPDADSAAESIRLQMRLQVKAFRGRYGRLIRSLLGEAQFDEELSKAFRDRWIMPRRAMARSVISRAAQQGDFRADVDPDTIVDLLYAPIYYRLQIGTGPLSDDYAEAVFQAALRGAGKPRERHAELDKSLGNAACGPEPEPQRTTRANPAVKNVRPLAPGKRRTG